MAVAKPTAREQWVTQSQLASDLAVSKGALQQRAKTHRWTAEYRERAGTGEVQGIALRDRIYPPDQEATLRSEIMKAKEARRGPWAHPLPRVTVVPPAMPSSESPTMLSELREIKGILQQLLARW